MPIIENIGPSAWGDAITLTDDEFWQVRRGPIYLATGAATAPADLTDGLILAEGDVVALVAGDVVRVRSATGANTASIVRRAKA